MFACGGLELKTMKIFKILKGPFSESPDRYGSQTAVTLTITFMGGLVKPVGATDPCAAFLVPA